MSDSKVIRQHINRVHSEDLLKYDAEVKSKMTAEKRVMDNFMMHSHKKMKAAGSSECEKVKDLCVNWTAKHYRPIQTVEDKGFIELVEFVNHLQNAVELPHRTSVTEHIRKKAAKGRIELKQCIKSEALFYCTTTDIWSSRALSAFIGFTIHYLTKE
ncbi:MAG: hypothetical protein GY775_21005, partial [Candidatus Scalindua sp.]|nr:hypothetical protein [Candidatus Scalindua sp.]